MISLRLPSELEEKLTEISNIEKRTRTDIIKESLILYFKSRDSVTSPYELGKKYFGKYKSGNPDNSVNFKERVRGKIRNKQNA